MNKNAHFLLHSTVAQVTMKQCVPGQKIGVELELEGRGVNMEGVAARGWKRTHDGSLRGESIEFVSAKPTSVADTKVMVNALFDKFKENGVNLKNSYRTSTHVHLNFCDQPIIKVLNFFVLFTMLEEALEAYSGEQRGGNLFCLSTRHGEQIIDVLQNDIRRGALVSFAQDAYKYAACNLCTLWKFGTVEVRTMRGADSAKQVNNWLSILEDMYSFTLKAKTPIEIIEAISFKGVDGFLNSIFKLDNRRELLSTFGVRDIHRSLLKGARICQMLCYEFQEEMETEYKKPDRGVGAFGDVYATDAVGLNLLRIYRPEKGPWHVEIAGHEGTPNLRLMDGMEISDARWIVYHADVGRFYDSRRAQYCYWSSHPTIRDEARDFRDFRFWDPDRGGAEVHIDHDDDDDEE